MIVKQLINDLKGSLDKLIDLKCNKDCGVCKLNRPVVYLDNGIYNACDVIKKLRKVL